MSAAAKDAPRVADTAGLAAALAERGHALAPADAPPAAAMPERPWFVSLLLGFAGWLAGAFGLGFLALAVSPGESAWLPIGVALLLAAWGVFRAVDESNFFGAQFGLVLSIAGQFCVVGGLAMTVFQHDDRLGALAFAAAALQLALVFFVPNRLHRMLCTLFACAAWAFGLRFGLWDGNAQHRYLHAQPIVAFGVPLLAWTAAWLPPALLLKHALRTEPRWMAAGHQALVRPACTGLVVALAWATLVSDPLDALRWSVDHTGADALWPWLSLLSASGALLAAFAMRSPGLMGVCIVGGLLHVVEFYNALAIPLLAKSLTRLAMGGLALALARRLKTLEGRS